jgi:hypothetical protein
METGAEHGMWTFQRYRSWLENRKNWHVPAEDGEPPDTEPPAVVPEQQLPVATVPAKPAASRKDAESPQPSPGKAPGRIEIEPVEGGFEKILRKLE